MEFYGVARLDHATFKLHGELPGCPHHVPDDDNEEKVRSGVEKEKTSKHPAPEPDKP